MKYKKIKIALTITVLVIIIITIFFVFNKGEEFEYTTAEVQIGNLLQTVSEVGTVRSAQEIELSFLQSGKIAKNSVKIGDKVKKDQILSELDYSSLSIKEQEAQANLEVAKANLEKLLIGSTPQEIAVSQANVNKAQSAYLSSLEEFEKTKNTTAESISQAEKNLSDLESEGSDNITIYEQAVETAQINLKNTKSTYQQLIYNKINIALSTIDNKLSVAKTALDNVSTVINDSDAKGVLSVQNISYLNNTNISYDTGISLLIIANNSLILAKNDNSKNNVDKSANDAQVCLDKVFETLNYCYSALEYSIISSSFTQIELDAFKTSISAQLTAVSTGISSVQTAQQNLSDAVLSYETNVSASEDSLNSALVNLDNAKKTALDILSSARVSGDQQISISQAKIDTAIESLNVAKAQLSQIKSSARIQDISLMRAQVKQAEASINLVKKQIEDSIIKAPINGTIIKIEYEVGEQITSAKSVVFMVGENNFEIEIDISEADISKLSIGNSSVITLDAFGDDVKFKGEIYFIEPAETVIQDVIYYKVKINFNSDGQDLSRIKPGMTANAIITTAKKENILIMPSRAIVDKNGEGKFAQVLINNEINEIPINIGLRGDGGMVEILSGVKSGDQVVTFTKEKK